MNILKLKIADLVKLKSKLVLPLVFALALCCIQTEAHSQTYSDLDGATIDLLETSFEQEMEKLKDEVNNPQPGISIESNRNVFHYYNAVWTKFQEENVEIKEAFILELDVLLQGPVAGHSLTQVLFHPSFDDAPPMDIKELEGTSLMITVTASPLRFFQTREEFRSHLINMGVSQGDISKVKGLFSYIRANK